MADNTKPQDRPVVTRAEAKAAGVKWYFTGEPCNHGHISERIVSSNGCKVCAYARRDAYRAADPRKELLAASAARAANPEKYRAKDRAHYAANREKILAKLAARYAANPQVRATAAAWEAANQEKLRAWRRAWLATPGNRENKRAWVTAYRKANPDKVRTWQDKARVLYRDQKNAKAAARRLASPEQFRAYKTNRRAREAQASGKHSAGDIKALLKMQQGKCAHPWCRKRLSVGYHIDHVIPLAIGGSNDRTNIQLLCQRCNTSKRDTHPIDYAQRHGMLL